MKIILFFLIGIFICAGSSYFYYAEKIDEALLVAFSNGVISEPAAISRFLSERAITYEDSPLKEKALTISCFAASGFLVEVIYYNLDFYGIYYPKADAETAYNITKEYEVTNC